MARAQAESLRPLPLRIATLKHRSEFLRLRHGARFAAQGFVLEGKPREKGDSAAAEPARFGFTVSKKVGGAVERNRIKRRLKAAVRDVAQEHAHAGFDYVLIARRAALDSAYEALVADLKKAFGRVHAVPTKGRGDRRSARVHPN